MDVLLEAARAGDPAARDRLAALVAPELRGFTDRHMGARLKRHLSISDVCQDVIVQALDALPALRPEATLDDFRRVLFQRARWLLLDRGRGAQRHAGESVAPDADSPQEQGTRTGLVTRGDELRHLRALVERLDPRYGDVIALRIEGRRFAEIAVAQNDTESNVRKRYQRAVAALRHQLEVRQRVSRAPGPDRPQ